MQLFEIILIHSMSSIIDNQVFIQEKPRDSEDELALSLGRASMDSHEIKIFQNQHSFPKLNIKSKSCFCLVYEGLFYIILLHEHPNNKTLLGFQCHQVKGLTYFSLSSSAKETELMKNIFNYQFLYKSQPVYYLHQRRISLKLKITFPEVHHDKTRIYTYFNQIIYKSIKAFHSLLLKIREADQSCLVRQYRNRQFADDASLIRMLSCSTAYFSLHVENDENQGSLFLINTQKNQIKKIKDAASCDHRLERQVNSLFISSQKTTHSVWIYDNIIHQGEMAMRKYKSLLVVSAKIQDKPDLKNYNKVELEIKEKSLKPIAQGGSAHIYAIKTAITSVNGVILKKKVQKIMALKTIKPGAEAALNGKFTREKKIISKLEESSTIFIPSYFTAANMQDEFRLSILMQYISGSQLDEFLRIRRISVSLKTKVYLLLNILYGLMQLGEREIVHMDLKPINIMVCRGLITKIIDFGEAFHREVCMKDYHPGFTFPYAAPEVYLNLIISTKQKQYLQFTQKQDIYSFGMLMYEVLFDTRMTQASHEKYKKIYVRCELKEREFQAPERLEDRGDWFILSSLRFIIDKCTDQNADLRPNFNWIAVFLKTILNQSKRL